MGGAVSAGEDNDELIDNLVEAEYIKTSLIERVFRAVDRADYYAEGCKENAYRDLAWKHGNLHLSAPCIYSEVMESLKLEPGMSFLNLGSGTGYLSTMVGLILGPYGINHGVELHDDVVDYARDKLDDFRSASSALDEYEFCHPKFVIGNCLLLDSSMHQYDRVYCGASCPAEHENYMKNLIRVGGILVMPLNDQVTRKTETTWDVKSILPVSFASLVLPGTTEAFSSVKLPDSQPLTLQEICRSTIRVILRRNIDLENPKLKDKKRRHPRRKKSKRCIRRIVIPIFEESDNDSSRNLSHGDANDNFPPERLDASEEQNQMPNEIAMIEHVVNQDVDLQMRGPSPETSGDTMATTEMDVYPSEDKPRTLEYGPENGNAKVSKETTNGQNHKKALASNGHGHNSDDSINAYPSDSEMIDYGRDETSEETFSGRSSESQQEDSFDRKRSVEEDDDPPVEARSRHGNEGLNVRKRAAAVIWKRVAFDELDSDSEKEENSRKAEEEVIEDCEIEGDYTYFMKEKIFSLPLPLTLKSYLNFLRPI